MKEHPVDAKKETSKRQGKRHGKKVSKRTKPAAGENYTIGNTDTVS